MSTPALIRFEDDGAIYLHWDGYPEDIYEEWEEFIADVQDKAMNDTRFGDGPYLAARFVTWWTRKNWPANGYGLSIGVCHPDKSYGQCYTYQVRGDKIRKL